MKDYDDRIKGKCYESAWNNVLEQIGLGLSVIFMIECILKNIALGFCLHAESYLRSSWNWLDFFVVIVSILDFIPNA